jgi:2-polyprenyl-3-methyl-5-hydroxy-6-metoxy-1,4-benzoquinol methylase
MNTDYQEFYKNNIDAIDTKWHQFTEVQFQWIIQSLQSKYNTDDHFTIIDLGCGTGRLLALVHEHFPNAILNGIDGTTLMVFRTQNRLPLGASIKKNDLNSYQLKNNYDVIVSTTVLHHLDNPSEHLNMISSHLNDKGTAYISEFAIDTWPLKIANAWWSLSMPAHRHAWSTKRFSALLSDACLTISKSDIKNDRLRA